MLPEKGPWPHPYYKIDDAFVDVGFEDVQGNARRVRVRHKALGDGPPMVLIHGLMNSSYSWRYVYEPLARRYRVLAPDLVGSGSTDKPTDMVYSIENVARFIDAYIRSVSREPVYLVGNSLGGVYCIRALLLPESERLARRFVLMHSPGYPMIKSHAMHAILGAPGIGPIMASLVAKTAHKFPEKFVEKNVHYYRKDMLSKEECVEHGRPFETLDGAKVFARILDESFAPEEHAATIAMMVEKKLPCPVKILYARKDALVPHEFGPLYHRDIPGSEFVWMDDASHFLHIDAPERTVEQIFAFDPR